MEFRFMSVMLMLLPAAVVSQGDLNLMDALGPTEKPARTEKPRAPAGGEGGDLSLLDFFNNPETTTPKTRPKTGPQNPSRPSNPKPDAGDFDLADALDPKNDGKIPKKTKGGFSDSDLTGVSQDETYNPDKGRGGAGGRSNQQDAGGSNNHQDNGETAQVATIGGIASAVVMALVGAVTSYISYQKKKFCFSLQQSLNVDLNKAENTEQENPAQPQVRKTLLEPPSDDPPAQVTVLA